MNFHRSKLTLNTLMMIVACTSSGSTTAKILVTDTTKSVNGWLYFNGYEPALFPDETNSDFEPSSGKEADTCVSLVMNFPSDIADLDKFVGRRVSLEGVAVKYDDLDSGDSNHDRPLSKKYYHGNLVENYCNRDYVFVVSSIQPDN